MADSLADAVPAAAQTAATLPPLEGSADLAGRLAEVDASLAGLRRLVEERLRYDEAKEAAFNRLYHDLDNERKNAAGEPLRPILRDLLSLYDHIVEAIESHPRQADALQMICEGLLEVLYRADVEPLRLADDRYDRSRQQIKRTEPTVEVACDWTVATVLREGFTFRDKVLRPQQVVVRRYAPTANANVSSEAGEKPKH